MSHEPTFVYSYATNFRALDIEYEKISRRILPQTQLSIRSGCAGQEIIEKVLRPLSKLWKGFKLLHDRTESNISHGLISSTRDLELMLIFGADPRNSNYAKYSARSELHTSPWTKYTKYCYQLTSLCDDYMGSTYPNWRDKHHVTELDFILTTHLTSSQWQHGNSDAILTPGGGSNNLDLTPSDTIMAALSHVAEASSTIDYDTGFQTNPWKLPSEDQNKFRGQVYYELLGQVDHEHSEEPYQKPSEQLSHELPGEFYDEAPWHTHYELSQDTSGKLLDPAIQDLSDCSIYELCSVSGSTKSTNDLIHSSCENCGEVFTSKAKDLRNNKQRHQDTVCARDYRFKCLENGCQRRFPRKDYLRKHELNAHAKTYKPDRRRSRRAVNGPTVPNQSRANLPPANSF